MENYRFWRSSGDSVQGFFARCVFILFSVCPSTLPNVFVPSLICLDRNRHSFLLNSYLKLLCIRPVLNTLADNEGEEANKKRRIFFWILYLQTQFAPFYFKSFEIQCKCRCTWRWINPKEVYLLNVNAFLTTLYVYTGIRL